jgi:hypothetical protein
LEHHRLLGGEFARRDQPLRAETAPRFRYTVRSGRGTQVGRERSAKPSFVGSIPTRASIFPLLFSVS